jgi:hypothetical protein
MIVLFPAFGAFVARTHSKPPDFDNPDQGAAP